LGVAYILFRLFKKPVNLMQSREITTVLRTTKPRKYTRRQNVEYLSVKLEDA